MAFVLESLCSKAPTAIDYGDIDELAEDCQSDVKSESDVQKEAEDNTDYDADDEEVG